MFPQVTFFFVILTSAATHECHQPINQAEALLHYRLSRHLSPLPVSVSISDKVTEKVNLNSRIYASNLNQEDDHFLKNGLPGQPAYGVNFKQYAGNIQVDERSGRSLFYYFVESCNSSSKPLVLWLNGAEDTYIFLMNWFHRYPAYKGRTLYLIGESYAGYYIPELADFILDNLNTPQNSTPVINLKGIMIGNGLIDDKSDTKGLFDYAWTNSLIADESHEELREKCPLDFKKSPECRSAVLRVLRDMGNINFLDLYRPQCGPDNIGEPPTHQPHPCDAVYTQSYLNRPDVQVALPANTTKLPYPWQPCSLRIWFKNDPETMFPIYKRLRAHGLHILLYSGDTDACVPAIGTRYALASMGLDIIERWHSWSISNTTDKVAGFKVVYNGITYATVLGAGHEVSTSHPDKLFYLLNNFIAMVGSK